MAAQPEPQLPAGLPPAVRATERQPAGAPLSSLGRRRPRHRPDDLGVPAPRKRGCAQPRAAGRGRGVHTNGRARPRARERDLGSEQRKGALRRQRRRDAPGIRPHLAGARGRSARHARLLFHPSRHGRPAGGVRARQAQGRPHQLQHPRLLERRHAGPGRPPERALSDRLPRAGALAGRLRLRPGGIAAPPRAASGRGRS